ncbi:MAG: hypothetical protein NWF04_09200 [Candidatus Bathyarchaeota archaeon]|nr:hypothetical protein [Candidatus Bathyarchaeota archaeon]
MQRKLIYAIALVAIVALVGGYVGFTVNQPESNPSPSPTLTPTPSETPQSSPLENENPPSEDDSTQQQARDQTMTYIETNHPETAQYMQSLSWTGGKIETELIGAQTYSYTTTHGEVGGAWWTVTLSYAVVLNPVYTVIVNYTQTGVQTPAEISWNGTWQTGTITETSYSFNP